MACTERPFWASALFSRDLCLRAGLLGTQRTTRSAAPRPSPSRKRAVRGAPTSTKVPPDAAHTESFGYPPLPPEDNKEIAVTTDPVQLLSSTIPDLFNSAIAEIRSQADGGDSDAKARLEGFISSPAMAVLVRLEGDSEKDLFVVYEGGKLTTTETRPLAPVLAAFAVSEEAFEVSLEELESDVEAGLARLKRRLLRAKPGRAQAALDKLKDAPVLFHYLTTDTPDFDEIRVKIALGAGEPPEDPTFTLGLDYDTFEELRAGKLKPQALLGRLQLSGDASRAMQWMMEQVQRRAG